MVLEGQTYLLSWRLHLLKTRGTSVESVLLFHEISMAGGKGPKMMQERDAWHLRSPAPLTMKNQFRANRVNKTQV